MNLTQDPLAHDYDTYRTVMGLWSMENPIKTSKLQFLLLVNGLLVSAVSVSGGGLTRDKWFVYAAGALFSTIWTLSIGRTALFQDAWKVKLEALRQLHMDDPRFAAHRTRREREQSPLLLRFAGSVPSSWYLVGSPLALALGWLVILTASIL